ncbi:J domain-containing protein [Endozoicomonadaceae bacterium StTr2]
MDEYGGNPAKAKKEIVKQLYRKPTDTGEHRKDLQKKFVTTTIKPWIADTLRTGGATPAEAEADAEQLIKGAGGYRNGNIFLMVSGTEAFQARNRRAVDEPNKMSRKEALKVLNLPSSATPAEIKKAFAKIARENHGDKLDQDDPVKEQTMRQAQIAYEQLTKGN